MQSRTPGGSVVLKRASMRVYGVPEAQARPEFYRRGNRVVTHSPKTRWYRAVCWQGRTCRPSEPMDAPVSLDVELIFPRPARRKDHWKDTKPDVDNVLKGIMDALSTPRANCSDNPPRARWWREDSRICKVCISKRFAQAGEEPGAVIEAQELAAQDARRIYREARLQAKAQADAEEELYAGRREARVHQEGNLGVHERRDDADRGEAFRERVA